MSALPISTVIPTYNRSHVVTKALDSVLAQCVADDEVIVVDDGSTDGTEPVLVPYKQRIRYVRQPHGGAGRARNHGVELARNPLVAFLDSDDEWMAGKLELQRALMQVRADVVFCFSNFAGRTSSGKERHDELARWHNGPTNWEEVLGPGVPYSSITPLPSGITDFRVHIGHLYEAQFFNDYVSSDTVVIRREAAGKFLRFPEDLPTFEDWECYGRLSKAGLAAYLDCETAWEISHGGPRLTDADWYQKGFCYAALIERVWGQDEDFLKRHGETYRRHLKMSRLVHVKGLIAHGQTREARSQLRFIEDPPALVRWIACLPGGLASTLVRVRKALLERTTPPPRWR